VTIEEDLETLDAGKAESEVVDAFTRLLQQTPSVRAVVLECTNLSPYKHKLRQYSGISVFDIVDAVHWMLESQ
jgi:Asp/Glu/hydantoin racemase